MKNLQALQIRKRLHAREWQSSEMFRKLKDKLADEVKANPRLQGTLDSVNQLAVQTYSSFTKEGSGSRDSLTSLSSQLSNVPCEANGLGNNGASSSQSDLVSLSSPGDLLQQLAKNSDPAYLWWSLKQDRLNCTTICKKRASARVVWSVPPPQLHLLQVLRRARLNSFLSEKTMSQ